MAKTRCAGISFVEDQQVRLTQQRPGDGEPLLLAPGHLVSALPDDCVQAAFGAGRSLGAAIVQINHPNYYWGMTPEVLIAIGNGAHLVEIANVQFERWNAGHKDHPAVEAQWDAALGKGIGLWGVASDDAHDYDELRKGKSPPGGGWVVVKARRDPQAILDSLAHGRFYSSTGVTLSRADVDGDELVIEIPSGPPNKYTITFIENGKPVATVDGLVARHVIPRTGYVRAVITRDDGKKAWVQPVRRGQSDT